MRGVDRPSPNPYLEPRKHASRLDGKTHLMLYSADINALVPAVAHLSTQCNEFCLVAMYRNLYNSRNTQKLIYCLNSCKTTMIKDLKFHPNIPTEIHRVWHKVSEIWKQIQPKPSTSDTHLEAWSCWKNELDDHQSALWWWWWWSVQSSIAWFMHYVCAFK